MRITAIALGAVLVLGGCAGNQKNGADEASEAPQTTATAGESSAPTASAPAAPSVPDSAIGLRKTSVFETNTPESVKVNDSSPGDRPAIARPHEEFPPAIPHAIVDQLPITPSKNDCLDCHEVEKKVPGEATPIPKSHYTDFRKAPGKVQKKLVGARNVCVSCHVPLNDNAPLVENKIGT